MTTTCEHTSRCMFYKKFPKYPIRHSLFKKKNNLHGPPIEIRKNLGEQCSAYTEPTKTSNMSYERKFYGLSEYVRF